MTKLTYIISDVDKAISFEWTAKALASNYELSFILIGAEQSVLASFLAGKRIQYSIVSDTLYRSWLSKLWAVVRLLYRTRPNVIHTHLWRANIIGLSAAWLLRIKKRVYTRHHAMVHHHEFRKGLWKDKLCNFMATDIIAISQNVMNILQQLEHVSSKKIKLVHHGFDVKYFMEVPQTEIEQVRIEWGIKPWYPVIGVVARYQKWKGIQYIIPAFKHLLSNFPDAHLILANAQGSYSSELKKQLATLPIGSFTEISFEANSAALYRLFNVYVHVPVDRESEAFGQTYIEALLCRVPSIFTLSGVAPEFIQDKHNAMVVPFENSEAIYSAMLTLLNDPQLRATITTNGLTAASHFDFDSAMNKLKVIYG